MAEDSGRLSRLSAVEPGTVLYDPEGDPVGVVTGVTGEGLEVTPPAEELAAEDGEASMVSAADDEAGVETEPGGAFGKAYLVWRCDECGEVGQVDGDLPEECPGCGAPGRTLYRVAED